MIDMRLPPLATQTGRRWQAPVRRAAMAACLLGACVLAGCAGVKVKSIDAAEYVAERRADILTSGQLSPASQESLRILGLELKPCVSDAPACRSAISEASGLSDEQRLSALAELWAMQALATQRQSHVAQAGTGGPTPPAIEAWLETARHAYAYLFFTARPPSARSFEDRQTQVRDYYNYAVQQAMVGLFEQLPPQDLQALAHGPLQWQNWQWHSDLGGLGRFGNDSKTLPRELIAAASLRFTGLRNTYRRDGLGAELVASFAEPGAPETTASPAVPEPESGPHRRRSSSPVFLEASVPAITALLRFAGTNQQEVLRSREVHIQVYDPYQYSSVMLANTRVPLAGNFTSGYGLWLARSGFSVQALRSLLGREQGLVSPSIYLMQPYDPKRRVIVMLHGLASSPEAWINVANEVLGDDALRQNYQIWQVYYPTNAPIAMNHAAIRRALQQTLQHFDPSGQAQASRQITLIGHSMGGVIARLMVSSAGQLSEQVQQESSIAPGDWPRLAPQLNKLLRFEPMPEVSDAIFIAAPHRGTDIANHRIARWIANLITLPFAMLEQVGDLTRTLAQMTPRPGQEGLLRVPNSIDNLSDQDVFVRLSSRLALAPGLRYHSIIGNDTPQLPLAHSSDGVVPYQSAHLAGAASEKVIASGHSVQEQPQAILEIRRILREQLQRKSSPP